MGSSSRCSSAACSASSLMSYTSAGGTLQNMLVVCHTISWPGVIPCGAALKDLGARPSVIYCAEIRHDAVEVLKNSANEVRAAALER